MQFTPKTKEMIEAIALISYPPPESRAVFIQYLMREETTLFRWFIDRFP